MKRGCCFAILAVELRDKADESCTVLHIDPDNNTGREGEHGESLHRGFHRYKPFFSFWEYCICRIAAFVFHQTFRFRWKDPSVDALQYNFHFLGNARKSVYCKSRN